MARNQEYLDKFRKQVWGASVAEQGLPKWRANPAAILRWCMLNALVIVGCLVIGLLAMANEWNRQAAEEANLLLATQVIFDATQTAIIGLAALTGEINLVRKQWEPPTEPRDVAKATEDIRAARQWNNLILSPVWKSLSGVEVVDMNRAWSINGPGGAMR